MFTGLLDSFLYYMDNSCADSVICS